MLADEESAPTQHSISSKSAVDTAKISRSYNLFTSKKENNLGINKENNRNIIIQNLLPIFKITNIGCFILIVLSIGADVYLSIATVSYEKIITGNVIIAIVTATTAQLVH